MPLFNGATTMVRQEAIDETKRAGDPQKAIALAIIYLADVVRQNGKG